MYCAQCGVKLADSEKKCPLCGLEAYHPQLAKQEGEPLYPAGQFPAAEVKPKALQGVLLILFVIPMLTMLLVDLRVNQTVTWSGFSVGAMLLFYVIAVLPTWFHNPNPVIFVPCDFAAIGLYLLYIDLATDGNWFLSLAFPMVGSIGLIITAMVTLLRYLRRGQLYVFGGASIALGGVMLLLEFLLVITFQRTFVGWSIYPLSGLVMVGCLLIYLAINDTAREMMERKLFI